MGRLKYVLLVALLLLNKSFAKLSIDFHQKSLKPDNEEFIEDDLVETCAAFSANDLQRIASFTEFRFAVLYKHVRDINVTLLGFSLGCGSNLYVSPISENEKEKWTGRRKSCQLVQTLSTDGTQEICDYQCYCNDGCEKMQVLKAPRSLEESSWKICHINITYQSFGGCDSVTSNFNDVYIINVAPLGELPQYKNLFCDMTTDGGGWTVILRRQDGSVEFTREWEDFKQGFGSLTGEFYAGHELIHQLTTSGRVYSLRVDLESYNGERIFAEYSQFSIGSESSNYTFNVTGFIDTSTAGDSLYSHNGMQFSTPRRDNDINPNSCAAVFNASWWYYTCHDALLTGHYGQYPSVAFNRGIRWRFPWGTTNFSRYATMMIRPSI